MANKKHGPPLVRSRIHLAKALLLECRVANREHLIDDEYLGLKMGCNGKSES